MAKKKQELTVEEKLAAALVREDEQPYEVPGNWVWTYLTKGYADCLDRYRKPINATERSNRNGEVPYYGATGQVGWIDDYLTDENLVLVGEDGAPFLDYLKEKAYIIDGKAWVNNHAHILKSFYGEIGNKYLMHYLNIFNFKEYVNGTTRLKLTQSSLNIIPIPLPPLAEQQRIVDRIESLFDQLDQAKALIQEALDSFATRKAAILHQAFTGALTKKWREEHGVGMESWEEISLKSLCSKITDGEHFRPPVVDKGIPFLSAKDVRNNGVSFQNVLYVANETANKALKRCNPEKGDILIVSRGATVGRMCIVDTDETFCLLGSVILLKVDKMNSHLLNYFLKAPSSNEKLIKVSGASAQQAIYLRDIKEILIPVPSKAEQQEIVRILDDLFEKEQAAKDLCDQIDQIDTIKKTILGQAFRGQLRTNVVGEESAVELLKELLIVV